MRTNSLTWEEPRVIAEDAILLRFRLDTGHLDPEGLAEIILPKTTPNSRGLVFSGSMPNWLAARLVHIALLACERYAWCGVCNMQNPGARATIVWSNDPTKPVGTYVPDLNEEEDRAIHVGPFGVDASRAELRQSAVAVLGAAHSGKSMFTYGLSECSRVEPAVWILRANPDGEGHWSNETSISLRDTYREQIKRNWDLPFAERMACVVRDLRPRSSVLIVDLAGLCSDELRLILRECSHAILLRRADGMGGDECDRFIAACEEDGIELIANLTSCLDAGTSVVGVEPASGRLMGVVAGLERGNRAVGDLCEPVYRALINRLVDH